MYSLDPIPYSRERLKKNTDTLCPECGRTKWLDTASGFLCENCGQDLEELLPPLCTFCKGGGFATRGGWVAGSCSFCGGKGTRERRRQLS